MLLSSASCMTIIVKHNDEENRNGAHEVHYTRDNGVRIYKINGVTVGEDDSALSDHLLTLEKGRVIFESDIKLTAYSIEKIETIFLEHEFLLEQFWVPFSAVGVSKEKMDPLSVNKNGKFNLLSPTFIKDDEEMMRHLMKEFPSWQAPPRQLDRSIKLKEQQSQSEETREENQSGTDLKN